METPWGVGEGGNSTRKTIRRKYKIKFCLSERREEMINDAAEKSKRNDSNVQIAPMVRTLFTFWERSTFFALHH